MLNFTPVTADAMTVMRPYYENCTYRLCEYSSGVKYMWRGHLHSEYAFTDGCLVIRNCIDGVPQFDYPIPGPEGDVDAALATIEDHCRRKGVRPIFSVVPESEAGKLALRWPRVTITNERAWKDYLYYAEDLAHFAGRHYSGQRNHINKFNKEHPGAEFIPLTAENADLLAAFWADYDREFQKQSPEAKRELALAQDLFTYLGTGMFRAGGILWEGRLLAIALAEKCGETLVCHIEKALYSHAGVYPAMVQKFADCYGGDCRWINREDDGRDRGLRTSKLQYLPAELGGKLRFEVGCELDALRHIPELTTERLTLSPFTDEDKAAARAAHRLDKPAFHQVVLNAARKRVRDVLLLGDVGDRHVRVAAFVCGLQDAKRVIATSRDIHYCPSPFNRSSKWSSSLLKSSTTACSSALYSGESSG